MVMVLPQSPILQVAVQECPKNFATQLSFGFVREKRKNNKATKRRKKGEDPMLSKGGRKSVGGRGGADLPK